MFLVDIFLVSTGLVAIAEIGDKTQLLALVLAARFRRPWPIAAGILLATLANHAVAALAGAWAGDLLQGPALRWVLGLSFLAVAVWALFPDRLDEREGLGARRAGAFLTTLGMMIANLPVVLAGEALAQRLPLRIIRPLAAASFAILGLLVLSGAMTWSTT